MIENIKNLSIETWDKMKLLDKSLGKLNEEGFTQDLIYTLLKSSSTLMVVEDSIVDPESVTGADFFWKLTNNESETVLAIQAKRAFSKKSYYKSLKYELSEKQKNDLKVNFGYQHELLNDYSVKHGYLPYYIFYNTLFNNSDNINFSRAANSDVEFDRYGNNNVFGITISPYSTIESFINNTQLSTIEYLFTEFLYDDDTLSLQEFLRRKALLPPNSGGPNGPNGTDETDGPDGSNGPNGTGETDNPNDQVNNIVFKKINDLTYVYSDRFTSYFSTSENAATEEYELLMDAVKEKHIENAKEIYKEEVRPRFEKVSHNLSFFREYIIAPKDLNKSTALKLLEAVIELRNTNRNLNGQKNYTILLELERNMRKIVGILNAKTPPLLYTYQRE